MKKTILVAIAFIIIIGINVFMYLDPPYADLVIIGKNIITLDSENPTTDFIAMREGKIIWLGNKDKGKSLVNKGTKVINLEKDQLVLPGIHESHGHLFGIGLKKLTLDASVFKSEEELFSGIQTAIDNSSTNEWIVVTGWHQEDIKLNTETINGYPTNESLNNRFLNNPVVLIHASYHMILANNLAIQASSLTNLQLADKGIIKNSNEVPTGVFLEKTKSFVLNNIKNSKHKLKKALKLSLESLSSNGITSFHEMGLTLEEAEVIAEYIQDTDIKNRIYFYVRSKEIESVDKIKKLLEGQGSNLKIQGIKVFIDGALGTRTAWLSKSYSDDDSFGMREIEDKHFESVLKYLQKNKMQLAVHVIGDKATDYVLDNIENLKLLKPRFEHFQLNRADQRIRIKKINGVASMQGIHYISDKDWAVKRIGKKRMKEIGYVWQKVNSEGILLLNGTDTPVESVNPINTLFAFVSDDERKLSFEDALKTQTLNPAIAVGASQSGMIKLGWKADFTVVSNDLRNVSDENYKNTDIVYTIVNGEIIYTKNE